MQFTDSKSQQQSPLVAFLATTVLVNSITVSLIDIGHLELKKGHHAALYRWFIKLKLNLEEGPTSSPKL